MKIASGGLILRVLLGYSTPDCACATPTNRVSVYCVTTDCACAATFCAERERERKSWNRFLKRQRAEKRLSPDRIFIQAQVHSSRRQPIKLIQIEIVFANSILRLDTVNGQDEGVKVVFFFVLKSVGEDKFV